MIFLVEKWVFLKIYFIKLVLCKRIIFFKKVIKIDLYLKILFECVFNSIKMNVFDMVDVVGSRGWDIYLVRFNSF